MILDDLYEMQVTLDEIRDDIAEEKERHRKEMRESYQALNSTLDDRQDAVREALKTFTVREIADAMEVDVQNIYAIRDSRRRKHYRA